MGAMTQNQKIDIKQHLLTISVSTVVTVIISTASITWGISAYAKEIDINTAQIALQAERQQQFYNEIMTRIERQEDKLDTVSADTAYIRGVIESL